MDHLLAPPLLGVRAAGADERVARDVPRAAESDVSDRNGVVMKAVFVVLAPTQRGDSESFVEIEDEQGTGVRVGHTWDRHGYRRIGPLLLDESAEQLQPIKRRCLYASCNNWFGVSPEIEDRVYCGRRDCAMERAKGERDAAGESDREPRG
jgi:hypothetical protein